ncbi:hypothetical protein [Nitrosomonas sp. Nm166]|uniref:hypothetical protein n=1 Tax=Nitrosomonas sp. Nm166 TaxID=1881054 RepID=UPI0015A54C8F|nr:hypothetical protein [Nitrosomonas sp. Nm166]
MGCFNMFSASFKTMVHPGLQADLVTPSAGSYAILHILARVRRCVVHDILLR